MPKIKLVQPPAGEHSVVPSEPFARIVLDFAPEYAYMEHPDGSSSLLFRFADGSSVELKDFYSQYGRDQLPVFEVDGEAITGADFFSAFGPECEPVSPSEYDASSGHGLKDMPPDRGVDKSQASLEPRPQDGGGDPAPAVAPAPDQGGGQDEAQSGSDIFSMKQAYAEELVLQDGPAEVELKEREDDLLSHGSEEEKEPPSGKDISLTADAIVKGVQGEEAAGGADEASILHATLHQNSLAAAAVRTVHDSTSEFYSEKALEAQVAVSNGI